MRLVRVTPLVAASLLLPNVASAAGNGSIDSAIAQFTSGIGAIANVTEAAGQNLFVGLSAIDMVWVVGWGAAGGLGLMEITALGARTLLGIGFFYWLLTNGPAFSNAIIQSFAMIGGQASGAIGGVPVVVPSDIFNAGVNIAHHIWEAMTWHDPGLCILLVLAGLILLWVFARLIGMMVEVIVESVIMTALGLVLLGFGGTSFTREYAIAFLRFCVSIGFKRMVLQVLVGIGTHWIVQFALTLQAGISPDWDTICYLVALPLLMLRLVETLPYRAQDIINGAVSHGSGSMLTTAMVVGSGVGAAVASATGAGAAGVAGLRLAAAQDAAAAGPASGIAGRIGQAARIGGRTVGTVGGAAASDIGRRLTGHYAASHGVRGWRMAADMDRLRQATPPGQADAP
jgi:type IV secretion system protein TrbL